MVRVGQGIDVHAFCPGDHVMLGGIRIAYEQGVKAHSDGDVVLHALADALLGALALGDIGHFFPDDDPQWAGADSAILLDQVYRKVVETGFCLINADITILAERPKIAPYNVAMRNRIAEILHTDPSAISVKATTTEKLGFIGRKEGIAAQAVVLLDSEQAES